MKEKEKNLHDEKAVSYEMFDKIASSYDRLNRILSFGIDIYWRKFVARRVVSCSPSSCLDLATGTGDLLFTISQKKKRQMTLIGSDMSRAMLEIAREKAKKKKISASFHLHDAASSPFESQSFDAITMSFGIRNHSNPKSVLKECARLIRKNGFVYILEFSLPKNFIIKPLYLFYLKYILPSIGKVISKNHRAYTYLSETIEDFPSGASFAELSNGSQLEMCNMFPLTFGVATLYVFKKK